MMENLTKRMERLRSERVTRLAELHKNTIAMRLISEEAQREGLSPYRIAKLLGVTNRTIYMWAKR